MAWVVAMVAQLAKQPLILAYIVAGFLIGPNSFKLVESRASIEVISQLGLIVLLFMVGLEIDLKKILSAGRVILLVSAVQILGCCLIGLAVFRLAGFSLGAEGLDALYLGIGLALSSTVIIVKVLHDKGELGTLAGRVTLGVLVLQDLFAILFLAVQPNLKEASFGTIGLSLVKVAGLMAVAFGISRYVLPPVFRKVSRSPEMILIGSLAWCFMIAGLAVSLHLSAEMGALFAGMAVSTFPYAIDVAAKLMSLRDFFVTLFFVALGMAIPQPSWSYVGWAIAAGALVMATRMITVFPTLMRSGQGMRASFMPAINLSQVSELSMVILAIGANPSLNHVTEKTEGIMAYTFVLMGVVSTYSMNRSDFLFRFAEPLFRKLRFRDLQEETAFIRAPQHKPRIFILGFSWTASSLVEEITRRNPALLEEIFVIDFNPVVNRELRRRLVSVAYGDITQKDTLEHLGVEHAEMIICSVPNVLLKGMDNLRLLQMLREITPKAKIVVNAERLADVPELYAAGADFVTTPRLLEARELLNVIEATRNNLLHEARAQIDADLKGRKEVIP